MHGGRSMPHHMCTRTRARAHAHIHVAHTPVHTHAGVRKLHTHTSPFAGSRAGSHEFPSLLPCSRAALPPSSLDRPRCSGKSSRHGDSPQTTVTLKLHSKKEGVKQGRDENRHCDNMFAVYCWSLQISAESSLAQGSRTRSLLLDLMTSSLPVSVVALTSRTIVRTSVWLFDREEMNGGREGRTEKGREGRGLEGRMEGRGGGGVNRLTTQSSKTQLKT